MVFKLIGKAIGFALKPVTEAIKAVGKAIIDAIVKVFPIDVIAEGLLSIVQEIWRLLLPNASPFRELAMAVEAVVWGIVCVVKVGLSGNPLRLVTLGVMILVEGLKFAAGVLMSIGSDAHTVGTVLVQFVCQSVFTVLFAVYAGIAFVVLIPLLILAVLSFVTDLGVAMVPAKHFNFAVYRDIAYRGFGSTENHPDEWWKRSGDIESNRHERRFLWHLRPCGYRRQPVEGTAECEPMPDGVPSRCAVPTIYGILRKGQSVRTRDLLPSWVRQTLEEAEDHARYRAMCDDTMSAYRPAARGACRQLAATGASTAKQRNAARLCVAEFCARGAAEPFCAALTRAIGSAADLEEFVSPSKIRRTIRLSKAFEAVVIVTLVLSVVSSGAMLAMSMAGHVHKAKEAWSAVAAQVRQAKEAWTLAEAATVDPEALAKQFLKN